MFYEIIEATTIENLSKKVNNYIKAGFIPLSGICHGEGNYLYQAMTCGTNAAIIPVEADAESCAECKAHQTLINIYCSNCKLWKRTA